MFAFFFGVFFFFLILINLLAYQGITTKQEEAMDSTPMFTLDGEAIQSFKAVGDSIYALSVYCQANSGYRSASLCLTDSTSAPATCTSTQASIGCDSAGGWAFGNLIPPFAVASGTTLKIRLKNTSSGDSIALRGKCDNPYIYGSLTNRQLITCSDGDAAFRIYGIYSDCPACTGNNCPDCTNNCFCGSSSGATTSTSTIMSDLFLKDNDISTIKAVSGFSDNKNYTIYYLPFLLFLYIFVIIFVCLIIFYTFLRIKFKK